MGVHTQFRLYRVRQSRRVVTSRTVINSTLAASASNSCAQATHLPASIPISIDPKGFGITVRMLGQALPLRTHFTPATSRNVSEQASAADSRRCIARRDPVGIAMTASIPMTPVSAAA